MYSLPPLTPPQDHVLALISAGSTISEAAQSVGVHRNTVHNWIHSPYFRLALDRARESKALFWQEESEKLAAAAIDTIRKLMTEASTPAGVRLKAAQFILSLAMAPPEQPASIFDLFHSPLAAAQHPPAPQTVHNSAQSTPEPPAPEIVHNSAQSTPVPPAPETSHNPAERPLGPVSRSSSKVGRNDSCPCGSGKKFKRCCLNDGGGTLGAVA